MGLISDTTEMVTFRCDGARDGKACGATFTGEPHEVTELGWGRHPFGKRHNRGDVWLCESCEAHFVAIWKKNERKAA